MDLVTFATDDHAATLALRAARGLLVEATRQTQTEATAFAVEATQIDLARASFQMHGLRAEPVILASGVVKAPSDDRHHPVVLVNRSLLAEPPEIDVLASVGDSESVTRALSKVLAEPPPRDFLFLAVDPPVPQFFPSEQVTASGTTGTLGACVTAASAQDGILTAGHVAPLGTTVHDSSGTNGQVTYSHNPATVAGVVPAADVAVIEHVPHVAVTGPPISTAASAEGRAAVEIHGAASGIVTTEVMGFTPFLYVPSMAGMWGQVYFTTAGVTQAGDSGSPTLLSGTETLIGHLVGASGHLTSYIQAIDLQLHASGSTLRASP